VSDLALAADAARTPLARDGSAPAGPRRLARIPPAWTIAAALAAVYLILAPPSGDLAAASYRSALFARAGLTLWDNSWYGGHHLLAYSLLAPALGALIGAQPLAALSITLASALFALLIDGRFPAHATRLAGAWFALGAAIDLLSNRIPFELGLPIALGALLVAERGRFGSALLLAVLASLASPVDGAFLALAFLAWTLAGPGRGRPALLTLAALAPVALLNIAFPEGGTQPFVASAFYPALAAVLAIAALIPPQRRLLRIGVALYALALAGSYLLPTSVGGNADRLGALLGAPVTALLLAGGSTLGRRPRLLLAVAPLLLYWQANAPVADFASAQRDDAATRAAYYAPLLGELRALGVGYGSAPTRPVRIEAVPLADHWEARWLAPHVMIARGWERQLDTLRNALFYEESRPLTAARYRAWLWAQAISYVALPDAPLDYSATAEATLLRAPALPPYLREVWHSAHWRLFAVRGARALAQPPAQLTQLSSDSFTLRAPRPGSYTARLRFTPYWALAGAGGCVSEAPGGWTRLQARRAGSLHVVIRFSLGRVLDHGPRCNFG
jgi:hypothetical protein